MKLYLKWFLMQGTFPLAGRTVWKIWGKIWVYPLLQEPLGGCLSGLAQTLLSGRTRKAPPPPDSMTTAVNLGFTAQRGPSHVTRDTRTSSMQCSAFQAWAKTCLNLLCLTTPLRNDMTVEREILGAFERITFVNLVTIVGHCLSKCLALWGYKLSDLNIYYRLYELYKMNAIKGHERDQRLTGTNFAHNSCIQWICINERDTVSLSLTNWLYNVNIFSVWRHVYFYIIKY
jgi:hypothetical protein